LLFGLFTTRVDFYWLLSFFLIMKNLRLLILFLMPLALFAQTPTPTPTPNDDNDVISVESRLITVPVSVLNTNGQPLLGLKLEDFNLTEEGKAQQIEQVGDAEKVPLEIALLIDVSKSVNPIFDLEKNTAAKFLLNVMKPDDRASIFLIGEKAVIIQSGQPSEKSAEMVKTIQPTTYQTAFYDTILLAADYLKKNSPPKSRKIILTLSDGEDNWSSLTREAEIKYDKELRKNIDSLNRSKKLELYAKYKEQAKVKSQSSVLLALQNADTVFYSLNPAGNSIQFNKISKAGQDSMQLFADQTGGTAFLPKFLPTTLKEPSQNRFNAQYNEETLQNIFNQLTNELRSQYLLQYYSDGSYADGKYVKLSVGLKNGKGLRLRARQGYFVEKK
jgi:VWFA-related protein